MNNFAPSTYFSMENHNADASLMKGDMMVTMMVTDDGDDDAPMMTMMMLFYTPIFKQEIGAFKTIEHNASKIYFTLFFP